MEACRIVEQDIIGECSVHKKNSEISNRIAPGANLALRGRLNPGSSLTSTFYKQETVYRKLATVEFRGEYNQQQIQLLPLGLEELIRGIAWYIL